MAPPIDAALAARLPHGDDAESKARRAALFAKHDAAGAGQLGLADAERAVIATLNVRGVFNIRPACARAFHAVRAATPAGQSAFVQRAEFRLLLLYVRHYLELFGAFEALGPSADRRLSLGEFRGAAERLRRWGVAVDDAEAEFRKLDTNNGGAVLFDEFCDWAIKKHLDLEDDDDFDAGDVGFRAAADSHLSVHAQRRARQNHKSLPALTGA